MHASSDSPDMNPQNFFRKGGVHKNSLGRDMHPYECLLVKYVITDLHERWQTPKHPATACWLRMLSNLIGLLPSQCGQEQSALQSTELDNCPHLMTHVRGKNNDKQQEENIIHNNYRIQKWTQSVRCIQHYGEVWWYLVIKVLSTASKHG